MNREILFRVWNGLEMVYDVMVGKFGIFYVNPSNNGIDKNDNASLSPYNTKYPGDIPLMQFSGKKDKNGVEIYEGDIVKFKSWRDSLQRTEDKVLEVKFMKGFFYPLVSFGDDFSDREYEIVGNIYENSNLLNK